MIDELYLIEANASGSSLIHRLDARVKFIVSIFLIIIVVAFPRTTQVYKIALPLLLFFSIIWILSELSFKIYLKRLLLTLPFGFFIIFFQIFFKNPYYTTWTNISIIPFIPVYLESIEFATILGIKFLLCITSVIILSSTTTMQDLLSAGRRLGLPSVLALSLGMMIRYLYLFAEMYERIVHALAGRNFYSFSSSLPYKYRIKTIGYAMGILFLRSYEQGERTFTAMQCRGYGSHVYDNIEPKKMNNFDLVALIAGIMIISIIVLFSTLFFNILPI